MALGDRIVLAGESPSESSSKKAAAKVIATVTDYRLPKPSSPLASIADGTVEFNQFEAAIATLAKDVKPQIGFGKTYSTAPAFKYEAKTSPPGEEMLELVGQEVFKVGARGLTRGLIENVLVSQDVHGWGEQYWYENVFLITGSGSKPFALMGDGGSLVCKKDGTILGIILATSERITLACPIEPVLAAFNCMPILNDAELIEILKSQSTKAAL